MSRGAIEPKDLVHEFDGWLPAGTRKFSWDDRNVFPESSAVSYSFTLFDLDGNVEWSTRTSGTQAKVPADIPDFATEKTYIWRLTGFTKQGVMNQQLWGMVSFLTPAQANALQADVKELKEHRAALERMSFREPSAKAAAQADINYYTALIAGYYSQHGVLMGAFDQLFSRDMDSEAIVNEAGGLALFFYRK